MARLFDWTGASTLIVVHLCLLLLVFGCSDALPPPGIATIDSPPREHESEPSPDSPAEEDNHDIQTPTVHADADDEHSYYGYGYADVVPGVDPYGPNAPPAIAIEPERHNYRSLRFKIKEGDDVLAAPNEGAALVVARDGAGISGAAIANSTANSTSMDDIISIFIAPYGYYQDPSIIEIRSDDLGFLVDSH